METERIAVMHFKSNQRQNQVLFIKLVVHLVCNKNSNKKYPKFAIESGKELLTQMRTN